MLLAIDTATRVTGLALYDQANGRVLAEETWTSNDNHSVELMPRLAALLAQQGVAPADLTGLVVSQGPGSFTGLRTGLSLAKGLALARGLPLVGVPTLDVTARPHFGQHLPVWAILQAGRGRLCAGRYLRRHGRWLREGDYVLAAVEGLAAQIEVPALLCGEIDRAEIDVLRRHLGDTAVFPPPSACLRRASVLAEIGWERLERGNADDAASLQAVYLHHPPIDG